MQRGSPQELRDELLVAGIASGSARGPLLELGHGALDVSLASGGARGFCWSCRPGCGDEERQGCHQQAG